MESRKSGKRGEEESKSRSCKAGFLRTNESISTSPPNPERQTGTHRRQSSQLSLKLANEPRAPPLSKPILPCLLLRDLDLVHDSSLHRADSCKPSVARHESRQNGSVGELLEQREGSLAEREVGGVESGGRGGARRVGSPS